MFDSKTCKSPVPDHFDENEKGPSSHDPPQYIGTVDFLPENKTN
jgi:hypothetical protein